MMLKVRFLDGTTMLFGGVASVSHNHDGGTVEFYTGLNGTGDIVAVFVTSAISGWWFQNYESRTPEEVK